MERTNTIFTCPVCGACLVRGNRAYRCPAGHSYDIAAEGYVHLLPPNRMHSKTPGDTKQMVRARREFLDAGHYQPFSDCLNRLAGEALSTLKSPVILDAGCGEGYYTGRLYREIAAQGVSPEAFGFDISKFAVKSAAKHCPGIGFAVASCFAIPIGTAAVDCLLDVFAPLVPEEFARVLKPGGTMILAVPSAKHLWGLKEILYDKPYQNEEKMTEYAGFSFVKRVPVRDRLVLESTEMIQNLFAMTPYYWKTPVEGSLRLQKMERLETEIGFDFLVYRRE